MAQADLIAVALVGTILAIGVYVVTKDLRYKALPLLDTTEEFEALVNGLESSGIHFERVLVGGSTLNNVIDINNHQKVHLRVKLADYHAAKAVFDRVVK